MIFERYSDVKAFHRDVCELLSKDEPKNLVLLGDLAVGLLGEDSMGWRDASKWVMASVKSGDKAVLAALMIPGGCNLQICAEKIDKEALTLLAREFKAAGISVPCVSAECILAEAFADVYSAVYSVNYSIAKRGRIYSLERINEGIPTDGYIRPAEPRDLAFLPYWWGGFFGESGVLESLDAYEKLISDENLYILEDDGIPVSMARIDQELERVCGLGLIFTPPYFRNKGYATKITASLTKQCLDTGYLPVLSTDLDNPVSNSIYQKIGYRPVCDTLEIDFRSEVGEK